MDNKPLNKTYRLTRDVVNPKLDRRERYDPDKLAWTAGDTFRLCKSAHSATPVLEAVNIQATPRNARGGIYPAHEGYQALMDALEPLPERLEDVLRAHHFYDTHGAATVLEWMFRNGKVTRETVEEACIALNAEP